MNNGASKKIKLKIEHKQPEKDWSEVFHLISSWDVDKVTNAKVMVVGAGALGNEVLKNLALLNVGSILIVDFDNIEYSNLSRSVLFREDFVGQPKAEVAAQQIKQINPNIKVQDIHGDIMCDVGLGVFKRMDVIIGCLDNRVARLYINRHSFHIGKTWVDGGIMNLDGQLAVYVKDKSCYECQLVDRDWDNIRQRLSCADVSMRNKLRGRIPTTPISASIIGAMQVQEAIKVIFEQKSQSLAGKKFNYYGLANEYLLYDQPSLNEYCESHEYIETVITSPLSSSTILNDLFTWLEDRFATNKVSIELDYDIILEVTTRRTEVSYDIIMPKPHFSNDLIDQYEKFPNEGLIYSKTISSISRTFPDINIPLKKLAIPPLHILKVQAEGETHFVELTGDEIFLAFK